MRYGEPDDPFDEDELQEGEELWEGDSDAQVLDALALHGVDLSQRREITFVCYAPNRLIAGSVARTLAAESYQTEIAEDEDEPLCSPYRLAVRATVAMAPTLEGVKSHSDEIEFLLDPFGIACDGWETAVGPPPH